MEGMKDNPPIPDSLQITQSQLVCDFCPIAKWFWNRVFGRDGDVLRKPFVGHPFECVSEHRVFAIVRQCEKYGHTLSAESDVCSRCFRTISKSQL